MCTITHTHIHTHTFDGVIIEPTSLESGSQERAAYTSFDVSLGVLIFLECSAIQEGEISGWPSRIRRIIWHERVVIISFAQNSGWDTIFTLNPVLLYSFWSIFIKKHEQVVFFLIQCDSSSLQRNQDPFNLHHQGTDYTITHTHIIKQTPVISAPFLLL